MDVQKTLYGVGLFLIPDSAFLVVFLTFASDPAVVAEALAAFLDDAGFVAARTRDQVFSKMV